MRADAAALLTLPDLLSTLQLPEETWNAPLIPLRRLPAALQKWGLCRCGAGSVDMVQGNA